MIMKNKNWMSVLFLFILTGIAIIVRVYYINNLMDEVSINEDIYNAAKVRLGTSGLASVFADGFHMQSLYIYTLYLFFLIFGNFTVAGVYLNILYQVLTVLMVYLIVKNVSNRYIGFTAGVIVSVIPMYVGNLAQVTMLNMQIFIAAVLCTVISYVVRIFYNRRKGMKATEPGQNIMPESIAVVPEPEASVVLDSSMKEILLDDLEDKKVQYIENPLPVPKRREHKEMDFAFEPTGNDDYDLKDMSGKDFFDIE